MFMKQNKFIIRYPTMQRVDFFFTKLVKTIAKESHPTLVCFFYRSFFIKEISLH